MISVEPFLVDMHACVRVCGIRISVGWEEFVVACDHFELRNYSLVHMTWDTCRNCVCWENHSETGCVVGLHPYNLSQMYV